MDNKVARRLLGWLRPRRPAMVALLRALVERESPSGDQPALVALARFLAAEWRKRGARVRLLPSPAGNILRAEVSPGRGRAPGQILVLGHMDTVYPRGALARQPFRVHRGQALGPGTVDMKSGLAQAVFAVEALRALQLAPVHRLVFLFTTDEEVGSAAGRPVVEREARRSAAVLVLEPASGLAGRLKTARKGVGEFRLVVRGRAAHAGIEPEKGVNAVHELAEQILRLRKLARRGATLNATVICGGGRTNVIPERAEARLDVRVPTVAEGRRLARALRRLRPLDPRARLRVSGGINRPPLERTASVARLFRQARTLGRQLGLRLEESSTGGGSDGNFTAALGVPTLDGLGGVGGGAHSPAEFVLIDRMPERAALLAALLLTL